MTASRSVWQAQKTREGGKARLLFPSFACTLITGAARLLLTTVERLSLDAGLDWALCDTDSMALAKPHSMDHETFVGECLKVARWFDLFNPYEIKGPLFKVEDINYGAESKDLAPLYCYAISSKRYALFNLDADGEPILRKASAHRLGDKSAPCDEDHAPTSIPKDMRPDILFPAPDAAASLVAAFVLVSVGRGEMPKAMRGGLTDGWPMWL
jgi:hypothetical protein